MDIQVAEAARMRLGAREPWAVAEARRRSRQKACAIADEGVSKVGAVDK